jgi:hypothetical protein
LADANHHILDKATVPFVVPGNIGSTPHH